MRGAHDAIIEVGKEFGKAFGKEYGLIEKYMMDDAEIAVVVIGSSAGTG